VNVHVTELQRQQDQHKARQARLWSGKIEAHPMIEPQIDIMVPDSKQKPRGKVPQLSVIALIAEMDERIRRLQLDLADAQARILSQAELICALDSIELSASAPMRSVSVIVSEVLRDFPGVSWADVKGVRRRRDLIRPRHLCMYAVYTERNDLSLPLIGKIFGGKDHSSIHHAVHKIRAEKEREAT
jgi:chromosomal replication initiation ATPase DnaA